MKTFVSKVLFISIIFILISVIIRDFVPYNIENEEFYEKQLVYSEFNKSVEFNTLFFGSSRINHQLSPVLFDSLLKKYNTNSYNFSIAGSFNPETYFLFENFLNESVSKGNIDLIIIELQAFNNLTSRNLFSHRSSYWNNPQYLLYSIRYIVYSDGTFAAKIKLALKYLVSFFYRLLSYPIVKDFNKNEHSNYLTKDKGYLSLDDQVRRNYPNSFNSEIKNRLRSDSSEIQNRNKASKKVNLLIEESGYCNEVFKELIFKLIRKAKEEKCHLVFLIPPRLSHNDYLNLLPFVRCLPDENIIQIADSDTNPEFYNSEYIFDRGHLNKRGGKIFTEKIVQKLISKKITAVYE